MIRTYDIDDELAAIIRADTDALPNPICDVDQRLVYTVDTVRDFLDGASDDAEAVLAMTPDDVIDQLLHAAADRIYETWAECCENILHDLRGRYSPPTS